MSRFPIRAAFLLGSLCLVAVIAYGQAPPDLRLSQARQPGETKPGTTLRIDTTGGYYEYGYYEDAKAAARRATKRTEAAMKALSEADTDEQREQAESDLREGVAEQFDLIVKEREEQIAELQARLEKLNKQLDERKAAKDEIVDLRVKVLINQAKGLGFYPGQNDVPGGKSDPFSSGIRWGYDTTPSSQPSQPGPMRREPSY